MSDPLASEALIATLVYTGVGVGVFLLAFFILLLIITVFAVNVRSAALRRRTVRPNLLSVALAATSARHVTGALDLRNGFRLHPRLGDK